MGLLSDGNYVLISFQQSIPCFAFCQPIVFAGLPTAARNLYKVGLPFNECFKKERNLVGLY
ncbi:MAG: hypothetical protein P1Q69_19445, partial [Candidatus Thorarchaeota archaeon]|nr:hypothetical protein [Candidatus Thorarchaeota archaeon]